MADLIKKLRTILSDELGEGTDSLRKLIEDLREHQGLTSRIEELEARVSGLEAEQKNVPKRTPAPKG